MTQPPITPGSPERAPVPSDPDQLPGAASFGGVFLGSLRSEVDEPDSVPEPFERLEVLFEGVVGLWRRHVLGAEQAAERLACLRLRGEDGIEWTLGPTSMRWYRRYPGGAWKLASPPRVATDALTRSAQDAVDKLTALAAPPVGAAPATVTDAAPAPTSTSDEPAPAGTAPAAAGAAVADVEAPEADGYGYGGGYGDPEPAPWSPPAPPTNPAPAAPADRGYGDPEPEEPAPARSVEVPRGDATGDAQVPARPAQDDELARMLSALARDTGIRVPGVAPDAP